MCLAQGPKCSDAGDAGARGPSASSQATTEPLYAHYAAE